MHKYLQNDICYFRSPISPWTGPQVKSLFRTFFFGMVYIFTIQKISLDWGPVQPFLNFDHDFGHICFLKKLWNFFGTKSGSYSGQKIISFSFGVFFDWEISIYFCQLFVHFRTLWNTLTYSALIGSASSYFKFPIFPQILRLRSGWTFCRITNIFIDIVVIMLTLLLLR